MSRIALDVHAHQVPIDRERLGQLPGVAWNADAGCLVVDGSPLKVSGLYEPSRLVEWMDEQQISQTFVSVPPPVYRQYLGESDACIWADYLNSGLLAIASAWSGRLSALMHLPLEHAGLASELWSRQGGKGFVGAALAAGGSPSIDYSSAALDPLWQGLDEARAFVFIHPGHCCDGRLAPFYLDNLIGNPYETTIAASKLLMADVPRRYPGIRFCLAHAGGYLGAACGRLQHGFATRRPGVPDDMEPPAQAVRRFYVDSIAHSDALLALAHETFGEDKVLFGSDWPFPMGDLHPDRREMK
ncbi:Amidohydrolase [compost metagenome]